MELIAEIERQKVVQQGRGVAVKMSPQTWSRVKDEMWRSWHINVPGMYVSGLKVSLDSSLEDDVLVVE